MLRHLTVFAVLMAAPAITFGEGSEYLKVRIAKPPIEGWDFNDTLLAHIPLTKEGSA